MSDFALLHGKSCLISGASRGIGAAIARTFVRHGARVIVASRDVAALEELAQELGPDVCKPCALDVRNLASINAAVSFAVASFGKLDVAVNNAATNPPSRSRLAEIQDSDFDDVIDVNLRSVFRSMRAQVTAMLQSGGGSIINIASAGAMVGFPMMSSYVASKHGVAGLTRAAALDYGRDNIRINAIAPGAILTEMLQAGSAATATGRARIEAVTPMGRIGAPSEVAATAVWLASDFASYVTGAIIPVDGGYTVA